MARFQSLLSYITLLFVASTYAAIGPVADLTVTNANISPDGFERAAIVVNNVFPAPLITGNMGDNFQLNLVNQMTNHTMLKTTSIHWHGFFQKGTNWADGPAFINQCPIASGNSFLYDFQVPGQAGTFWYHSHLSTQYCDGLRGPFVVYDPNDPHLNLYDVDDDSTVITLADWYHVAAKLGPRFPLGADSTLINGLGRSTSTPTADLAVISVTKGKRYRFRLVSISCDPNYTFSIDGHQLTVIEADGVSTQPVTVDSIQIFAAQRYSFVLNANQDVDNYWIRANPNFGTTGFADGVNSAILRYDGADPVEPVTNQTGTTLLLETDLHPLASMPVPGQPTQGGADLNLNMAFNFDGTNFFINGESFTPPTVPVLLQIISGANTAQDLLPSGSVYSLPSNSSIEITFPATTAAPGAPHPFHLHGHVFAVVRSAGSTSYNYDDPVWRDVVSTGTPQAGDNVTIRFQTDNPGPWFLHCHIDFHLDAGFAVVMAEDIPDVVDANPVPQAWSDLCPTYNALDPSDQ
ncbi:Cu-oxidase-domain-containing protein [Lentinus tigrinus ALCF2SS1-7]|uniref:laccase n=1 Tax=Lentinus tigrinus ALCF2SS1-6 TaxID=1328759 RepID=A0A5C2S1A8_9APHY|nr:Cu-oxidase-domain-containing protein [Lentinus tigrinus ALCF2SS1-6]RPD82234.1 Cu-oxidase-domain-containing protein [Lentinus tigrinus ALCF2SS1-7]